MGGFFILMEAKRIQLKKAVAVVEVLSADLLTPLAVYLKLAGWRDVSFLLESVEGGTNVARYSFVGVGPKFRVRAIGDRTEIVRGVKSEIIDKPILEFLRSHLSQFDIETSGDVLPFSCGAIGYLGFDAVECFEPSLRKIAETGTNAEFMIFNSMIAFDHVKQEIRIVTLADTGDAENPDTLPTQERAQERAKEINGSIRNQLEFGEIVLPEVVEETSTSATDSDWSQTEFENAVVSVKEMITAGECYQVVLSRQIRRQTTASAVAIYRALRSINPSPYMFLLNVGGKTIIGASPEMLVRSAGKRLEYRPIAGTRPRGNTATEDEQLAEEMCLDPKELAEHMMLVDLGRNDLGRVAKFGSVSVDKLIQVEKYSHVQHLVSELSAELADGRDRFDALAACFPAGTVSGAPKVRAIQIIRELEPVDRGVYAGAVGYFDYAGNMDTCIAIRTIVLENGVATLQTGAGIVADSVPESEYKETVNKAAAMLKAIDIAEAGGK